MSANGSKKRIPKKIITAIIGAMGLVVAALITGIYNERAAAHTPTPSFIPSATISPTPAGFTSPPSPSPAWQASAPSSGSTPNRPPPSVPLLTPVEQPGWVLKWHGKESIGPAGVKMTVSGPQTANGGNYDLQYLPGSGWEGNSGGSIGSVAFWLNTYRPSPSTINGLFGGNYQDPMGAEASVGDRICLGANYGIDGVETIVYMQVISVGPSGVVVDMWLWDKS
jgi:hypothetical protein